MKNYLNVLSVGVLVLMLSACGGKGTVEVFDKNYDVEVNVEESLTESQDDKVKNEKIVSALKDSKWVKENFTMQDEIFYFDDIKPHIDTEQQFSFIKLNNDKVIVKAYATSNLQEGDMYGGDDFEQYFLVEVKNGKVVTKNYWHSAPGTALKSDISFDVNNNVMREKSSNYRMDLEYFYNIDDFNFENKNAISWHTIIDEDGERNWKEENGGIEIKEFNVREFLPLTAENIDKIL